MSEIIEKWCYADKVVYRSAKSKIEHKGIKKMCDGGKY